MKARHSLLHVSLLCGSLFYGCDILDPGDPGDSAHGSEAGVLYMVGADTESGALYAMNLEDTSLSSSLTQVHKDSHLKTWGGEVYVIERYLKDNISRYDPQSATIASQTALPDGANPQDLAFVSAKKAYVSCLNSANLYVINPRAGNVLDSINLSHYAYAAGGATTPYAGPLEIIDEDLYVGLQRLDGAFQPGLPTLIVKIDLSDNTVADTIACNHKNVQDMVAVDGKLYVCNAGVTFSTEGSTLGDEAVEVVDVSSGSVSIALTSDAIAGEPSAIVHKDGDLFYISCMVSWGNTGVGEFDMASGKRRSTLDGVSDAAGGLCYDATRELLFVGEKKMDAPGILVFKDNSLIAGPILPSGGLPPYSIAGM